MKKLLLNKINLLVISLFLSAELSFGQSVEQLNKLITGVNYGVPSSPAFELLPDKPSEITHLVTPSDVSSNITNVFSGTKLKTGVAFDGRPLAYNIGSLKEYQEDKFKQILWRTVFSVGTAPENKETNDVFVGAGLRIPIIDKGDPRRNKNYIDKLEKAFIKAMKPPTTFEDNDNSKTEEEKDKEFIKRITEAADSEEVKNVRKTFLKDTWNATKWDVGFAIAARAKNGYVKSDSLKHDRWGLWTAAAIPLGSLAQLTFSGKSSWISSDENEKETNRVISGARARFFLTECLSASSEYARVWSNYKNNSSLDESWNHFAIFAEVKVFKGWLGLGYGGDSSRRDSPDSKFLFNYAIYTDKLLKK